MDPTRPYWTLLDPNGPYWNLLDPSGPYWTLLDPNGWRPLPEGALRAGYTQACGDGDKQGRKPANIRPSIEFTSLQNALCAHPRFLGALISIFRRYVHAWIGNGKECNQYRLHSDSLSFAQLRSASFSSVQLCSSSLSFPQLPPSSFSFAEFGWTSFSFPQRRTSTLSA